MTATVTSIRRARGAATRRQAEQDASARLVTVLVVAVALLAIVGLGATLSASSVVGLETYGDSLYFFKRQLLWLVLGAVAGLVASRIPYRLYRKVAVPLFVATLAGLVLVLVAGTAVNGSRRWLAVGPVVVQPSELAKFSTIVFLAVLLERKRRHLHRLGHLLGPLAVSVGLVAFLVLRQPDLGTTLIIGAVGMAMVLVAGAPVLLVLGIGSAGALAATLLAVIEPYRRRRILAFLDPWADPLGNGFQLIQSYLALGTGGLFGVGLGASRARWSYLPNAHTDFIFAIIGEETGFVGALVILGLFAVLTAVGISIAYRTRDTFGRLLATGIVTWLTVQALVNVGGVVGVLPITGIALPFVSVGGSALITSFGAIGVLANIARHPAGGRG